MIKDVHLVTFVDVCGSTQTQAIDLRNTDRPTIDCKANSSDHCSYQWIRNDTSAVICSSPTLTIGPLEAGQYVCEATCILRDQRCTVKPLVVNLAAGEGV